MTVHLFVKINMTVPSVSLKDVLSFVNWSNQSIKNVAKYRYKGGRTMKALCKSIVEYWYNGRRKMKVEVRKKKDDE